MHPNEALLRNAYAAFARGDLDGYLRACTEDFVFEAPGQNAMSGTYRGREGLFAIARKAMEISGGTFQEDVEDVLANDRHGVVLARHRLTRGAQAKDYRTAHVYDILDGALVRCWEHPRDASAFDDAWGPRSR